MAGKHSLRFRQTEKPCFLPRHAKTVHPIQKEIRRSIFTIPFAEKTVRGVLQRILESRLILLATKNLRSCTRIAKRCTFPQRVVRELEDTIFITRASLKTIHGQLRKILEYPSIPLTMNMA